MGATHRLRQTLGRLTASSSEIHAEELRHDARDPGETTVADAPDRELVTVRGILRTVTLRPRGGVPALEAELYDGTAVLTVIWLGRRRIAGVEPGRQIQVMGRIGTQHGHRVMFNPRYELRH